MSEAAREIKVSRSPVKHQSPEISVRDPLPLPLLIQQALNCLQAGDIAGALGILAAAPATARDGERNTARHADPIRFIAVRHHVCAGGVGHVAGRAGGRATRGVGAFGQRDEPRRGRRVHSTARANREGHTVKAIGRMRIR
jgi:hypothetical protein